MSAAIDTLRWGDVESIPVPALGETLQQFTKQLVQAHWRWPLTWQVQLSFVAQFPFSNLITETADFLFDVEFTLGCGQGLMKYVETFTMTNASGYADVSVTRQLPSQDMQIRVQARSSKVVTQETQLVVGAMVAPLTEPHAPTFLHDMMAAASTAAQPGQTAQWMREGFVPEALTYDPRFQR